MIVAPLFTASVMPLAILNELAFVLAPKTSTGKIRTGLFCTPKSLLAKPRKIIPAIDVPWVGAWFGGVKGSAIESAGKRNPG